MANMIFPSEMTRVVIGVGSAGTPLTSVASQTATIYTDAGGTTPASVFSYPDNVALASSHVSLDSNGKLPFFFGPDTTTTTLYCKVGSGPVTPIYARCVGTDDPTQKQYHANQLSGATSGASNGLPLNYKAVSTNGTDTAGDYVAADCTSGVVTRTLPTGPTKGQLLTYEKTDTGANTLVVAAPGGGTITYRGTTDTTAAISSASTWIFEADGVGANTWRVVATNAGSNGTNGNTILTTSGAPSAGTGANGDYAIDPTAKLIYGPKTAGAWGSGTSIVGPAGSTATLAGSQIGAYYTSPVWAGAWNVGAGTLNLLYYTPIWLEPGTLDRLAQEHAASPTAGETCRMGLFADTGRGWPGNLLGATEGTIDLSTSVGIKAVTISQAVTRGLYWLGSVHQGSSATATLVVYGGGSNRSGAVILPSMMASGGVHLYDNVSALTQSGVSGALPATAAVNGAITGNTTSLAAWVRYSA